MLGRHDRIFRGRHRPTANKPYGRDICRVLLPWSPEGKHLPPSTRERKKVTADLSGVEIIELSHGKLQ